LNREKYLGLFIDEARENLKTYSNQLVAFEKELQRNGRPESTHPDAQPISEIFRAAHSVKGMAASLEFQIIVDVAHCLEDLADKVRAHGRADRETIDLLLDGGDQLRALVEQVASAEPLRLDDDEFVSTVKVKSRQLQDQKADANEISEEKENAEVWAAGQNVIEIFMDTGSPQKNIHAFMLLHKCKGLSGFIESKPTASEVKAGGFADGHLCLRLTEDTDPEAMIQNLKSATGILRIEKRPAPPLAEAETEAKDNQKKAESHPSQNHENGDKKLILEGEAQSADETGSDGGMTIRVRFDPQAPLIHARAYMVHRIVSDLPGFTHSQPEAIAIRQGQLPDQKVDFFFEDSSDPTAIIARTKIEPSVQSVEVLQKDISETGGQPSGRAAAVAEKAERTVRIRTDILDDFTDSVGELLLVKSKLRMLANESTQNELGELVDDVEGLVRDLHTRVVMARLTPLSQITDWLPPMVRKLARQLKKQVQFEIADNQVELDRAILDELSSPLVHLIRNAIDHGAETAEERAAIGKPPSMRLRLSANRQGDMVCLELADDGKGIAPKAILQRAIEKDMITPEQGAILTQTEILELICQPGFTTANEVSETSGRGVGMDAVRATLERLGGHLGIKSDLGTGTVFTMRLPLTMAIVKVLVIGLDEGGQNDVYAIPIHRVERALDLRLYTIEQNQKHRFLNIEGQLVPLLDLPAELGFAVSSDQASDVGVLVKEGERRKAFCIGHIIGQEEVMIKPLGPPLSTLQYLSGGAILGDGRTAYILEPTQLGRLE
jgi:two-component system, chemotaxis family, sensor kinase CheA